MKETDEDLLWRLMTDEQRNKCRCPKCLNGMLILPKVRYKTQLQPNFVCHKCQTPVWQTLFGPKWVIGELLEEE